MTNIRNFFKKKGKKKEDSLDKKIWLHRLTIFYRTLLALALAGALTIMLIIQIKNRTYTTYQVVSSVEKTAIADSVMTALGSNILIYSNDGASCINRKGETQWNQTYEMQSPMISICQDMAAIGDRNGTKIYLADTQKTVGEIDTKMPIRNFTVSANGVVAAVLDDASNVTWIYLFNAKGETVAYFKTTMKKSGYPICVAISDNGCLVGVSYFYMDSGTMRNSVAFYNFGPVGQNEIDNFVSSYDYADTVVPYIRFLGGGKAVAVADNRLALYEGDQKPVSIADILLSNEIVAPYYGDGYIALVYNDTMGNALYKMDIYNDSGKLEDTVLLDMQYKDILFCKGKMIAYNEQECYIHTIGGGDMYHEDFDKQALMLIPENSAHRFVMITPNSIDTIELK